MQINNKWLNGAIPALLIHCSIGTVYCWSLFKNNIGKTMGIETPEWAFSLAIFFLGMSAAFGGKLVEKNVRKSAFISTICFSLPIIEHLLQVTTVFNMFYILGIIYLICMLFGAILIKKPHADINVKVENLSLSDIKNMIFNKTYLAIWFVFFINITCGLAIISQEKNILLTFDNLGLSIGAIAMLTAAANSFGRFAYSTFSDYISNRGVVYELIFITSMLFTLPAIFSGNTGMGLLVIVIMMLFINMGYGGGFSTLPSLLSDKFGMRNVSIIHGFALSAWAWAGLVGNQLGTYLITNYNYMVLYVVLVLFYLLTLIINHKLIMPLK